MTVSVEEIARYMRMGRARPDGPLLERVVAIREKSLGVIHPAAVWRRLPVRDGAVVSGALSLEISGTLERHLAGCGSAFLACATLGTAFDAFQRRLSVSSGIDALIAQATGAALIERLMDETEDKIRADLAPGETLVQRYSPGYGTFPLAAQRTHLAILDAPRTVGVSLTDTLLMVPSKSVSAVIGVRKDRN